MCEREREREEEKALMSSAYLKKLNEYSGDLKNKSLKNAQIQVPQVFCSGKIYLSGHKSHKTITHIHYL